jgi:hypothetical protein
MNFRPLYMHMGSTQLARAQLTWGAFGLSADDGAQLSGRTRHRIRDRGSG